MGKKTVKDFIESKLVNQWLTDGETYFYCGSIQLVPNRIYKRDELAFLGYSIEVKKGKRSFHYTNVIEVTNPVDKILNMYIERDKNLKTKLNKIVAKHSLLQ